MKMRNMILLVNFYRLNTFFIELRTKKYEDLSGIKLILLNFTYNKHF